MNHHTGNVRIVNSAAILRLEDHMYTSNMISRNYSIRGVNLDYKPTGRYSHRVTITLLF